VPHLLGRAGPGGTGPGVAAPPPSTRGWESMTESLQATDVNGLLATRTNAMAKRAKTRWLCPHLLNGRSADATTATLPVLSAMGDFGQCGALCPEVGAFDQ